MRPSSGNCRQSSYRHQISPQIPHKKDKYSFSQEPRFSNLNINILQSVEGSSKKILHREPIKDNVWEDFMTKAECNPKPDEKRHEFSDKKCDSRNPLKSGKKMLRMGEFDKEVSHFASINPKDPKIEKLKKTIFTNFSNTADFYSLDNKSHFKTENKQEFKSPSHSRQPRFANLLMEYKLGGSEKKSEDVVKSSDFAKKIYTPKLGKKPEFIRDLQKPSFFIFSSSEGR